MADPAPPFFAAQTSQARPRWQTALTAAVTVLLALHYALAVGSKLDESTTSDELVHLTGGFSYWQNHDYRLHPENGILPQRWAALPVWLAGAKFPPLADNEYWRTSDAWVTGHQFFYETGEDHFPRLMAGRAMIALFSVATGLLVFVWSRRLFGVPGALVSLWFFVFSPSFLAHGALATSDVCMAFFFLAAAGTWWRHLHSAGRQNARVWWLSAVMLGLAFVAKYTAVLLIPMMAVMALVRALAPAPLTFGRWTFATPARKFGAVTLSALAQAVVVAGVIWVFYGLRYSAFNPALPPASRFIYPWATIESDLGAAGWMIHQLATWHALPEGYLYGFSYVLESTRIRAAFLNGDYSLTGWPSFFPWTFILKSTVPLMLACVLVARVAIHRWQRSGASLRADLYRVMPLVTLLVVYWIFSITSHINIGHRHILPTYPVLYIGLGVLGAWLTTQRRIALATVALLLGWQTLSAARVAPHFLAYFNEIAGGPDNGYRHLVDSSLDWGQDLPGLKTWLDRNAKGQPAYLAYFGTGEPAYYGLRVQRLPFVNNFKFPVFYTPLTAGVYCISATMLQHVYSPVRGPWTVELEKEFQQLRALEPAFAGAMRDAKTHEELVRVMGAERWQLAVTRYDVLRFARLCLYLRARAPEAKIGYSIFIYRLTAAEIAGATAGPVSTLAQLIENPAPAQR